jgi:hypothetical protein
MSSMAAPFANRDRLLCATLVGWGCNPNIEAVTLTRDSEGGLDRDADRAECWVPGFNLLCNCQLPDLTLVATTSCTTSCR